MTIHVNINAYGWEDFQTIGPDNVKGRTVSLPHLRLNVSVEAEITTNAELDVVSIQFQSVRVFGLLRDSRTALDSVGALSEPVELIPIVNLQPVDKVYDIDDRPAD